MLERYFDLMPFSTVNPELSLGEGNTPLIASHALASEFGIRSLYFKNEMQNPTWSFKDRGTIAGLQHAIALGFRKIGTVSTGNMAVSVAAYGAHAGLDTCVLVSGDIADEKLPPIAVHGPRLFKVEGDYGELYQRSLELGAEHDIYFINSDVPFRVEGSKAIAFEICEQLEYQVPDYVVVPVSAGGNFRGIVKGFEEMKSIGLTDRVPTIIAGQAEGCSPIAAAFASGGDTVSQFPEPETIAHAIENPSPPSGNQVLRKLHEHGGMAMTVTDEEIVAAQALLAKEGLFGQPASAVPLAVVSRMLDRGQLRESHSVVCIVTGAGLKYMAALERHALVTETVKLAKLGKVLARQE
jgi:threonine synthase